MKDRIGEIVNAIPVSEVFADVGCDHGYVAKEMLRRGKCRFAVASDISPKCLEKAKRLLKKEIDYGRATCVVSDGFDGLYNVDTALIAGMGGEEIISILKGAEELPENLVLQPMKNCDKVRKFAVSAGYRIISDYVFESDDKFYNLMVLKKGEDLLTEEEAEFGRTNLISPSEDFRKMLIKEAEKLTAYAENSPEEKKKKLLKKAERLLKYAENRRIF